VFRRTQSQLRKVWLVPLCLLIVTACLTLSGSTSAASLEELRECLAANVPKRSSALTVRLQSRDRAGREYAHEARIYWKKSPEGFSRTLVCMTSPRDVRGLAYVAHEHDSEHTLWVYLPEEGRTVRINPREAVSRGRIARTAISYEDIRYLPLNMSEAEVEETRDSVVGGRRLSMVRLALPRGTGSLYDRVISFVDPETCVPLRIEFQGAGGKAHKVATADPDSLEHVQTTWLARSTRIEDLRREVVTSLVVEKIEIDEDLPDRIFEPMSQRGRCPGP
jgi:hypothetical protein